MTQPDDPSPERLRYTETLIKRRLEEEQNLHFTVDRLPTLKGFLICEDGFRGIAVADDLDAASRLFLYFHMLGHIYCGHTHPVFLTIRCERRTRENLSTPELFEERSADRWAKGYLKLMLAQSEGPQAAMCNELTLVLKSRRQAEGLVAGPAAMTSSALYDWSALYRSLRNTPSAERLAAALTSSRVV